MALSSIRFESPYFLIQIRVAKCTSRWISKSSSPLDCAVLSCSSLPTPSVFSRLTGNEYPQSVPIASSSPTSDLLLGSSDRGMAFHSIQDINASRSAAVALLLRIWLKDTTHVVATAFAEPR